jgi:hypothetical protein
MATRITQTLQGSRTPRRHHPTVARKRLAAAVRRTGFARRPDPGGGEGGGWRKGADGI